MRIYVAGPYTHGDTAQNVKNAIEAADTLLTLGHAPYVPHLTHFWHLVSPKEYEAWTKLDIEWLKVCDAIVRLEGRSPGSVAEMKLAKELDLKIYKTLGDVPKC